MAASSKSEVDCTYCWIAFSSALLRITTQCWKWLWEFLMLKGLKSWLGFFRYLWRKNRDLHNLFMQKVLERNLLCRSTYLLNVVIPSRLGKISISGRVYKECFWGYDNLKKSNQVIVLFKLNMDYQRNDYVHPLTLLWQFWNYLYSFLTKRKHNGNA